MIVEEGRRTAAAEELWTHIFEGVRGFLQIFTGERVPDGKLKDTASRYFSFPTKRREAAEWALEESDRSREAYFCAHLLTNKRRVKENAAPMRALYVDGDGAQPEGGLSEPTAIIESSPGRLQMWWRLGSEVPPQIGEDLNMRLAYAMGADKSGWDLTQLLRVPGTRNYKYPDAPPVRVSSLSEESYSPTELSTSLPPVVTERNSCNGHHTEGGPDEPPVELNPDALKVWRGETPKMKANGSREVDRSRTLLYIGRVLYDAGANRAAIVPALQERDIALGYEKYTNNRDGGEREYRRIVEKLEKEGRNLKLRVNSGGRDAQDEGGSEVKGNQADRLIQYALDSGVPLFVDQFGVSHTLIGGESLALNSRSYNWLRSLMWKHERRSVNGEALKTAAGTLAAFASATGGVKHLHTRAAYHDGRVYYELGKGRVLEVDRDGYRKVENPPVLFRSVPNLKNLPEPERGGSLDALDALVNLKEDHDKRMFKVALVTAPLAHIPRPIVQPTGVMGSGKSTLSRAYKRVWDPTTPETVRIDPRDFIQKASHSYIVMLDNQDSIPGWALDIVCRLVTGEGDSKRKHYTDDEDIIYELKRAVVVNGINPPADRPDYQDRTLPLELERIPDSRRCSEEKLWEDFERNHAKILGVLFDALSSTLKHKETIVLATHPRLADWGEYAAAAYEAFGWTKELFSEDWAKITRAQHENAIEGSAVAQCIISLMEEHDTYSAAPSKMLEVLETEAEKLKINVKRDKTWPGSPKWLWRRIREVKPVLSAVGIDADKSRDKKARDIILTKGSPIGDNNGGGGDKNSPSVVTSDPAQTAESREGDNSENKPGVFSPSSTSEENEPPDPLNCGKGGANGEDTQEPREVPGNDVPVVMLSTDERTVLGALSRFGSTGISIGRWQQEAYHFGVDDPPFTECADQLRELGLVEEEPEERYGVYRVIPEARGPEPFEFEVDSVKCLYKPMQREDSGRETVSGKSLEFEVDSVKGDIAEDVGEDVSGKPFKFEIDGVEWSYMPGEDAPE